MWEGEGSQIVAEAVGNLGFLGYVELLLIFCGYVERVSAWKWYYSIW